MAYEENGTEAILHIHFASDICKYDLRSVKFMQDVIKKYEEKKFSFSSFDKKILSVFVAV